VTATGLRLATAAMLAMALSACIMVPRTVYRVQPGCQIVAREMTLQPVQIASIGGCSNQACATLVAVAAITGIASAVISGSIAVVGNVVYWLERQGQCREAPVTVPAPTTPSPAPAVFPPGGGAASPAA
jgi:hypothetical protein